MRLQMQQITGALLYLSVQTRPNIAKAVNICSENASNPTKIRLQAAHEILEYALATKQYSLRYGTTDETFTAAGDAAFGDCHVVPLTAMCSSCMEGQSSRHRRSRIPSRIRQSKPLLHCRRDITKCVHLIFFANVSELDRVRLIALIENRTFQNSKQT
jgi:hypothetical protein